MNDAMTKHPEADVLVNFASLRSAYQSTVETMEFPQIRTIAIIAEGIPENQTRKLIKLANEKNVSIIGPATVGGVKPGCFKIGNTGGMMDNILHSKLYRPGSVAYVSRSGGMSNELNNIVSKSTDGVYEGVAIGGDRYPGTTFMDHIMRCVQVETSALQVHATSCVVQIPSRRERQDDHSAGRSGWRRRVRSVQRPQEQDHNQTFGGLVYRHLRRNVHFGGPVRARRFLR
jgi:hypothetical protein